MNATPNYSSLALPTASLSTKPTKPPDTAPQLTVRPKPVPPVLCYNRVAELQREANERQKHKIDLSRERVGKRLDLASRIAEQEKNPSAMATSELGIANVFGHITKHEDVSKGKADYSQAKSVSDIGRMLLAQIGYNEPSQAAIDAAVAANMQFIEPLQAIRGQRARRYARAIGIHRIDGFKQYQGIAQNCA